MAKKSEKTIKDTTQKPKRDNSSEFRLGKITHEEARFIENTLPLSTYAEVARQLNRKPVTVRKWAQRNNIVRDKVSSRKYTVHKIKQDPTFKEMEKMLTDDEIILAHDDYINMCEQFGNDILYSERQEIIDYIIITCLLNREWVREREINVELDRSVSEKRSYEKKRLSAEDPDDLDDEWMDMIDAVDMRIADLREESKSVKDRQNVLIQRKDSLRKSLNSSRSSRADNLTHATQNFGALTEYLKKNPEYRKQLGLELEKMRLGCTSEWFRLSEIHPYMDGVPDYPVFNSEVVENILEEEKNNELHE